MKQKLDEHQEPVTDYDEGMVRRLIERITVYEDHLDFESNPVLRPRSRCKHSKHPDISGAPSGASFFYVLGTGIFRKPVL